MDFLAKCWVFGLFLVSYLGVALASVGDKSPYYHNCISSCLKQSCQNNVLLYKKGMEESITDHIAELIKYKNFDVSAWTTDIIRWNCRDECKYTCMHRTTEAFIARNWKIPQFHGKWPFMRFLGMQEPASVIFSALNFFVHLKGIARFRHEVQSDAPLFLVWHAFAFICLNAWTWSMVFHARDFPLTELFDYVFAYSMVLASFWCMVKRVTYGKSRQIDGLVTMLCILFFFNHFAYLSYNTFDYSYNMKVNIVTGFLGGIGWMTWCVLQLRKRPYVRKMLLFVILALVSVILEVYDFPPVFQTFDAHSLWHFSSAPISILFYKFITEDCKQLRKEMTFEKEEKQKLL